MALSVGMAACGKKPVIVEEKKGARAVRVSTVEQRPMAGGLSASGLLISREEAAVNPELSGYRVAKVYVEVDARVREGQPLAQLDDTLLKSQIAQQTALVAQQQVAADQAASQARDVEGLDSQGVLSKETIDQRRYAARSARAALDAQTAQLHDLQTRDARLTIRAPVAGLIIERNIRPGDVASPSAATPMFRMARDKLVELEAAVAEGDLGGVRVGDPVQVDLPAELPAVYVDAPLVTQVLCNLLENGVKHTPPGTSLRVTAEAQPQGVSVIVEDDGPGLPPGDAERLFEKFQRGHDEGNTGGAGLGLAICRAIVRAHGGDITAGNRPEGGARFAFTLDTVGPVT